MTRQMPDTFDFEYMDYGIHPLDDLPDVVLRRKAEARLGQKMAADLTRNQILQFLKGE